MIRTAVEYFEFGVRGVRRGTGRWLLRVRPNLDEELREALETQQKASEPYLQTPI